MWFGFTLAHSPFPSLVANIIRVLTIMDMTYGELGKRRGEERKGEERDYRQEIKWLVQGLVESTSKPFVAPGA